ncbi:hypothetical protein MATL_G00149590 [Megalops atlanticus]|uniref:Uncharacterized protein n=1 Tax=Megalops atlanticus TaxID=7932 RepID=A0A9D3T253_MEGAT|nr:hypothetical protein MATL_G00149590 [Megalops atlanticus]
MGCTPSKSCATTYTHEQVCRDWDTCSTLVPSLKSSVSTPQRLSSGLCLEAGGGKQTFLTVPCRDSQTRSLSLPSSPDAWSTSSPQCPLLACTQPSAKLSCSDTDASDSETPSSNER